uniref:CCR4-NOT transcription complex subunit 1 n=1 Tax=Romanomermis culicivorax TaxID=13658 RepID=A0A915KW17_ROMCU
MYIQLLTDHLRFLAPFLRNIEFQKSIAMVYAGTLRILLVILHDIPELLCEYHYALCDVIPANCIQLRNLILSAYPRNMRLPDPFMPNLKIFKPPNPWTKAILNVMAELHQQPDLKLNLKFEIEVLFRHLSVDISTLKIGNVLKDPIMMERAMKEPQLSNPIRLEKPTMANTLQPSPVPPTTVGTVISSTAVQPIEEQGSSVQTSATPIPVTARFNYHDIYVNNFQGYQGLIPHITVNASLPIFQLNPPLKHLVKPAVEHAVHELMMPVSDRAIKVAMTTTENVIKKDFALDADDSRLRIAAQNMARSLAAGMAMITCRDPLAYGIQGYLKQGFYSSIRGATTEQQRMIEEAVQIRTVLTTFLIITDDNVELAQCFIVKFAAERATVEVDKRMASEFDVRRQARLESRQYYDSSMAKYQSERLPEAIRLKLGSPDQQQLSVYDEFGKNSLNYSKLLRLAAYVPGFKSMSADDMFSGSGTTPVAFQSAAVASQPGALSSTGNLQRHFWPGSAAIRDLDARLQLAQPQAAQTYTACQGVLTLREALAMASQNPRDTVGAQALLQKLVDVTLEAYMPRLIPHHLSTPQEINDYKDWNQLLCDAFLSAVKSFTFIFGGQWIQKQVTKTLIDCRQESRFNVDAVELLIRHQLVNMITYDLQLATTMDNGLNYKAVDFAQHLVRRLFYEDRQMPGCSETDLSNTIDMLNRIANTRMGNAENSAAFGRQSVMDDFGPSFRSSAVSSLAAIMNSAVQGQQFVPDIFPPICISFTCGKNVRRLP